MRHPYMTNAQRLRSAQTMHDRDVPESDEQLNSYDAWSNSLEGEMWRDDTVCRLLAGEAVYATESWGVRDRQAVLEEIQSRAGRKWSDLSSEEKESVEAWTDYCDAVAADWLASRYMKPRHDLWVLKNAATRELEKHLERYAAQLVDRFEREYFDKYVWGAK